MKKKLILIFLSLFGSLTITFPPDLSGSVHALAVAPVSSASDLIDAVNSLRASRGLPAYTVNSILMGTSQAQANYMASIGMWSDYGPGGSKLGQRLLAAGYPLAGDLSLGGLASQNVIQGTSSMTAQDAINAWMGDEPHRIALLSTNLYEIGAGAATDGEGKVYYAIQAAAPTGSRQPQAYTPSAGTEDTPVAQNQTISVAIVSTPDEKGNVYHEVQPGQTLWQIALAYKTTIDQIKQLNNLTSNDIYPGDKLLIARVGTPTPIPPTPTATRNPLTSTPLPTVAFFTETPTAEATPVLTAPVSGPAGAGGAVIAIVLVALAAAGLIAWFGRSRPI